MNRKECLSSCRLYGIVDTGYIAEHQLLPVTEKLLAGGLRILQLRAKNHNPEHIENMGRQLVPLCRKCGCLFIVNDYPEIALSIGADGVHLGQDDGNLASARALLGKDAVIGRSTHSPEQALDACGEQADYIGFGPLFPTGTKPGRQAIGLEDIASVRQQLPEKFPRLLYRRHQWEHTALRTGGGGKQGRHRFLAAYTLRHYGNSRNTQKGIGGSIRKNMRFHPYYPCLSSSSSERADREISRTAVSTIICKMRS